MAQQLLTEDEIDDVLYLARADEKAELLSFIQDLAQKYRAQQSDVLVACIGPEGGNTVLHYCGANGLNCESLTLNLLGVQSLISA